MTFDHGSLPIILVAMAVQLGSLNPPLVAAVQTPISLGYYTWGVDTWSVPNNEFLRFAQSEAVQSISKMGDVWFEVGQDTGGGVLFAKDRIMPFMKAMRQATKSNEGVLYLTYGDFGTHNESALLSFIEDLFAWLGTLSQEDIKAVAPLGISLDIENAGMQSLVILALTKLREYKEKYLSYLPEGAFRIQQVVGGFPDSATTSYTMDLADSALYLVYRSYMTDPSPMRLNPGNNLLARFKWLMTLQCINCLDPLYKPRAKISILVEGACYIGEYCGLISFCAQSESKINNVLQTLEDFDNQARTAEWMPPGRFDELMDPVSRYGIHDWYWSRCFYPDEISKSYVNCGAHITQATGLCQALAKTPQT